MKTRRLFLLMVVLSVMAMGAAAKAQAPGQVKPDADAAQQDGDDGQLTDEEKKAIADETPAQRLERSWRLLSDGVTNAKRYEVRTQALNALSGLRFNPRANRMIAEAMKDPMLDVRIAAVLAAGKTKSRALLGPVKSLLNDPEPEVVFAAATTLWKDFQDRSGRDVLTAVAVGSRKANGSLMHGAQHDMSRTMHSPGTMAKIGAQTSAGLLLGPFGFSVAAVEYMQKNGADSARIHAINLLAEEKTHGLHEEMVASLEDKDPGVRAAALKVLGDFHERADAVSIGGLLDDAKLPVRLAAAAAYIEVAGGVGGKVLRR